MQSAVAMRTLDVTSSEEEKLDCGVATSRIAFSRRIDTDNDDLLDDNEMERILSRPVVYRRKLDLCEAPEFVQRLSSYHEAFVGEAVTFTGQYKAFPKPMVKWFKDEEEVKETKRHRIDLSSESVGIVRLIIQDVVRQDEGAYKCKVENQEGVASTTGYLSVSAKSPDKNNALQTKKLAQDRVSTPPYLRPIAEQKSMEEREEKEYQRLPPSPLQEFMDKIRHSAKSMHAPIVYADLAGVYPDDEVIKDFEEESEEDVFDEDQNTSTPSGSPVEEMPSGEALGHNENNIPSNDNENSIQVVDVFISPSVDLKAAPFTTTQASNEENADDSDYQDVHITPLDSDDPSKTSLRSRRIKLALQRSQAVEIAENEAVPSENQQTLSLRSHNNCSCCQRLPDETYKTNTTVSCIVIRTGVSDEPKTGETISQAQQLNIRQTSGTCNTASESLADIFFRWLDSSWIQFFVGFIMSVTAVSLAAEIPPEYMILAVAVISIASFRVIECRQKSV